MVVAISFDDMLLDQYKWARGLWRYGVRGTFYINPFYVGFDGFLSLEQLRRMHDEWGHTIANHSWLHEAPASNGGTRIEILERNVSVGSEWLKENGFGDGARLLALPYGMIGGKWKQEHLERLWPLCDQIRDVGTGINKRGSRILSAIETTEIQKANDDKLVCYYFHGNHNTRDRDFVKLLDGLIAANVSFSSMLEEAKNV